MLIHSSIGGHLDYFHLLAVVNSVAAAFVYKCMLELSIREMSPWSMVGIGIVVSQFSVCL